MPSEQTAAPTTFARRVTTWNPRSREVLPIVEYWTFYATARRQMPPDQFAPIHDLYVRHHAAHQSGSTCTPHQHPVTVDRAHDVIKTLIEEQTHLRPSHRRHPRSTSRLPPARLVPRHRRTRTAQRPDPLPTSKTTPDLYDRLRAYYEPTRAGTVALYLAGATPDAIRATTLDDLAQWHHNPAHPVAGVTVPAEAAPYLRAALLSRAFEGATPDAPAFPGTTAGSLLDIRQAATDLDLNIGEATLNETHTVGTRRVPASIVKLERLT